MGSLLLIGVGLCGLAPPRPPAALLRPSRPAVRMSSNAPEESAGGGRVPALLERRVPYAQQAVVQLKEVQQEPFYPWASLPLPALLPRLGVVYVLFSLIGGAIACNTYAFPTDALQIGLAANMGGCAFLLLFTLRIYSGWSFVSDRLGEEILDYEESGWADGFQAKKPEEVRARDQFLNEFTVKPVLAKFRPVVGAIAVAAVLSIIAFKLVEGQPDLQYSAEYLNNLQSDDKAAEIEQLRAVQSGKPAYCFDRYYKAVAGGSMCD